MLFQRPKLLFSNKIEAVRDDDAELDPLMIDTDKDTAWKEEMEIHVNDAKLGALLYFPMIGLVLTSCVGDMYRRNSTFHREPNTARALLVDCPVQDPDHVWLVLVSSYLVMVGSIGILCHAMLGLNLGNRLIGNSTRIRVTTCRICLLLIYCGMYHYNVCMGSMPYLKKKSAQVYLTCIILFVSSETLSMPVVVQTSKSSSFPSERERKQAQKRKPPRWPLFLLKMMVFIPYANAGWHKVYRGFNGDNLRAALMGHYIWFEPPIALAFMDYPVITSASAVATLVFECAGWILVYFEYDRLAAGVAFSFHFGIYLAMNINYLLFWGCSFVFFFVPSIVSSNVFQRLVKRPLSGGETIKLMSVSMTVPSGCSSLFLMGKINDENDKENEGPNENYKRKRKSSVFTAVCCALALTYKGFYPPLTMLPALPQSLRHTYLSGVYETISEMAAKPFNSYTMFAGVYFPTKRVVPFFVLKPRLTSGDDTKNEVKDEPAAPYRRVKWIPRGPADEYFVTNMLKKLHNSNKDNRYILNLHSSKTNTVSKSIVTHCHVFACLAQHHILGEAEMTLRTRGRLGEVTVDGLWEIDSIELIEESYSKSSAIVENGVVASDASSLRKETTTLCALDITTNGVVGNEVDGSKAKAKGYRHEDDDSCGDILAELDASARSFDASPVEEPNKYKNKNPFYIEPVVPHREFNNGHFDIGMGTVVMAMLIVGYKTYLFTD